MPSMKEHVASTERCENIIDVTHLPPDDYIIVVSAIPSEARLTTWTTAVLDDTTSVTFQLNY